mgnify:CR=1 FL=1
MTDPMQRAIQRVLQGEPTKRVARELGLPPSSVRYFAKRRRAQIEAQEEVAREQTGTHSTGQIEGTPKTVNPVGWLEDARKIQAWLMKDIARQLYGKDVRLRDLVVTFGIITDKIHQADAMALEGFREGVGVAATAQATVIIKVQEGNEVMTLEEFVGRPPSLAAGSAESVGPEHA